ncbi:hypothetical protein BDV30DRAFT_22591 [Aspergillus minisclerotigenes]|uniref:Uncharacterized protein n=1 Tax=Aspergillus minisclerotigenes TaxID=656917 RepID=A0A5N6JEC9_9EURO|nr:hypothetical protein BDV30DRAFT_22591 [Aspergillus minisclerotigenes]
MDSRDIEFKRSLKDLGSPTREPNAAEILSLSQASCDSGIPPLIPSLTRFLWIFLFFFLPVLPSPLSDCSTQSHSVLSFLLPSQQITMVGNNYSSLLTQAATLPCEHKKRTKYELLGFLISGNFLACRLRAERDRERGGLLQHNASTLDED